MDFKQVFLYDGTPYLAFRGSDGEYDYPNDEWTETPPPEGLYEPIYFNGNEWKGASKEEWEKSIQKKKEEELSKLPPYEPTPIERLAATSQLQTAKTARRLQTLEQTQAKSLVNDAEKDRKIKVLEEQVARLMFELTKKGSVE